MTLWNAYTHLLDISLKLGGTTDTGVCFAPGNADLL